MLSATLSCGNEVELLVDDGDARRLGIAHAGEADVFAVDADRSLIVGIDAGQDLHQRRFAGAVFAHQRMDFAGPELEADVAKRCDAAETLGDAAGGQDRARRAVDAELAT